MKTHPKTPKPRRRGLTHKQKDQRIASLEQEVKRLKREIRLGKEPIDGPGGIILLPSYKEVRVTC